MAMTSKERGFRRAVYAHYKKHRRILPWRPPSPPAGGYVKEPAINPYHVLVSEFMLQQTQVERVKGAYEAFIESFPTVGILASSPAREVVAAWQGLGYNRRALALHRSAEQIVRTHAGRVPSEVDELLTLPGVGPSTAGAVRAFAYNKPALFIETNIRRAYIHHFFKKEEVVSDARIMEILEKTLDRSRSREWYYALMDYGSALAKRVSNPNRRSAHYARQSAFEGSDRQLRGEALRMLLQSSLSRRELERRLGDDTVRARRIIASLARDGFIIEEKTLLRLA